MLFICSGVMPLWPERLDIKTSVNISLLQTTQDLIANLFFKLSGSLKQVKSCFYYGLFATTSCHLNLNCVSARGLPLIWFHDLTVLSVKTNFM